MIRFIIAIVGFVIAGAVFMLYTRPAYDTVRSIQAEIAQYDQALEKANELQRLKQTLLSRYNSFNPTDVDRLHKLLPDHVDNVRLVLDFDNLANQHNLAIQNVVVGKDNEGPANGGKVVAAAAVVGGNSKAYDSLTLKFSTQGTYTNFIAFMEDVERSLRIVDMVSLNLSSAGSGSTGSTGSTGGEAVYRFDVAIRTYWLK